MDLVRHSLDGTPQLVLVVPNDCKEAPLLILRSPVAE